MRKMRWFLVLALAFAASCSGSGGTTDPGAAPDVPVDGTTDPGLPPADEGTPDATPDLPPTDALPDAEPDGSVPGDLPGEVPEDVPADVAPDVPPYPEPAARILYDLFVTPVDGFFPWDRHLAENGSILVDAGDFSNASLPILADGPYPERLKAVHGFATYAPLVFQASVPVDPASLPADLAASTAEDSPVRLYALKDDGSLGDRTPFLATAMPYPEDGYYLVRLLPAWPLAAKRYFLVVTDALKATDGTPLARSRGFAQVLGVAALPADAPASRVAQLEAEAQRIKPLLAALPDANRVSAACTFTTTRAWDDGEALQTVFARFVPPSLPPEIPFDVDLDDNGTPDVHTDGQVPGCAMPAAEMGWAIHGTFGPLNLTDPDGHWQREADGTWKTYAPEDVAFTLMVPPGPGPHPVVVVGHGIASDMGGMCDLARRLVRGGMAALRFDWPRHGSRAKDPEGDATMWGMDFLGIDDPIRIRENFRQAAVDVASSLVLVDELAATPGLWTEGGPRLDTARVGYLGHSLGSLIGLLYLPFSTRVQAFLANVGGLGMFHLVELYVQRVFGDIFLAQGYINAGEHAIWAGDAIAYGSALRVGYFRPQDPPVRMLAQEVMGDDTIANASTEVFARTADLPQVGPVSQAIPGLQTADATQVESGIFQFTGVSHGAITDGDATGPGDLMKRQAIRYLESWFKTGRTEILTQ